MLDRLRRLVLAALRVPAEPLAPEGTPGSALIFRAGRNFYRRQLMGWLLTALGSIVGLIVAYRFFSRLLLRSPSWVQMLYSAGEIATLLGLAVALPVTFLALKWQYELRWYIVTDRSLRIRRGVWDVEELTMTFANIQEIRVTSGPVQKILGLADVEVTSAGGGRREQGGRKTHIASFEGVDNASEIRDLIVERLRSYRDSGLGSSAKIPQPELQTSVSGAALAAAGAVLDEVKSLHTALERL